MPYEEIVDIGLADGVLIRYSRSGRPIALVFPDGSDLLARPPAGHGLGLLLAVRLIAIAELLGARHDRPTFVPREWVTEFHAARDAREPRLAHNL